MHTQLTGAHRTTFDAIFQHPIARNLKWIDVRAMLLSLADAVQEHGDVLKIVRNGRSLVLHRPARSGMGDIADLMKVRHFLEHSDVPEPLPDNDELQMLVVIDHRLARVFRTELHGSVAQRIVAADSPGAERHLHYVQEDSNGQRKPEQKAFYDAIAAAMQGARQILIFGSSTGASSAMDHLLQELKSHHKALAERVVGSLVVNEQHLSENQLLAKAREFFLTVPV